jgi:hypothetical protein
MFAFFLMIVFPFTSYFISSSITHHGTGKIGMIASKTLREAFFFNNKAGMGYAIDNNLLKCNGWKSVSKLVHDTTESDLI